MLKRTLSSGYPVSEESWLELFAFEPGPHPHPELDYCGFARRLANWTMPGPRPGVSNNIPLEVEGCPSTTPNWVFWYVLFGLFPMNHLI